MKKFMNVFIKNILAVFGLVIGITISNMVIGATNGGFSAGSVDIDTTNMPNISGTTLADALDYLYEKAELVGRCPDGYACLNSITLEWATDKTYMGIAYLNPADLGETCNAPLVSENLNNKSTRTPTEVKEGCMKWYIYGTDENDDYLAILDHNTTATVQWNTTNKNGNVAFENSVAYSYLTDLTKPVSQGGSGWVVTPRIISGQEIANLTENGSWSASGNWYYFGSNSTTEYSSMNASQKARQESFAWLFDYIYSCTSRGCNVGDPNYYNLANDTSITSRSVGYWTSTPVGNVGEGSKVWYVESEGMLYSGQSVTYKGVGLRPVITIPRTLIS